MSWKMLYNFDVEGQIPPKPANISQISRVFRRSLGQEDRVPTCSLCLIPINLSLNKLWNMGGDRISQAFSDRGVLDNFGEKTVTESYWLLTTDEAVEMEEELQVEEKRAILVKRAGATCDIPRIVDAVAPILLREGNSGSFCFKRPLLCQETINVERPKIISDYDPPLYVTKREDIHVVVCKDGYGKLRLLCSSENGKHINSLATKLFYAKNPSEAN